MTLSLIFPLVDDMETNINWIDFVLQIIKKGKKVLLLIELGQLHHVDNNTKRAQLQMIVLALSNNWSMLYFAGSSITKSTQKFNHP